VALFESLQIKMYDLPVFLFTSFSGQNSYVLGGGGIQKAKSDDTAVRICSYCCHMLRVQTPDTKRDARTIQRLCLVLTIVCFIVSTLGGATNLFVLILG
jgi:hypothetical protein